MDNNYFASGQFLIETEYDDWENMLHVMLKSFTETVEYPDRTQSNIDLNSISLGYTNWVLEKVKAQNIPIESIIPNQSWFISYNPYGYQGVHNHTNEENLISTVMYFDNKEQDDIKRMLHFIRTCGTYSNLVKQAQSKQKIIDKMI